MISVYLCDDNPVLLEKYQKILLKTAEKHNIRIKTKLFHHGEQLLFDLSEAPNEADIIYLDILMEPLNGIEAAKKLRNLGCRAEIIFLTSSEQYVFDSFEVSPMYYLLKEDTTVSKFEEIFLRAIGLLNKKQKEVFVCESGSVVKQIPLDSISYFEIKNRVVTVHFEGGEFDFYSSMERLENELKDRSFTRTHRSFMINLKYVDRIEKDEITLVTGERIPLGTTYAKAIKLAFSKHLVYTI